MVITILNPESPYQYSVRPDLGMATPAEFNILPALPPSERHVGQFPAPAELRADDGAGVHELEATATINRELDESRYRFIEVRHPREAPPALERFRDQVLLILFPSSRVRGQLRHVSELRFRAIAPRSTPAPNRRPLACP